MNKNEADLRMKLRNVSFSSACLTFRWKTTVDVKFAHHIRSQKPVIIDTHIIDVCQIQLIVVYLIRLKWELQVSI